MRPAITEWNLYILWVYSYISVAAALWEKLCYWLFINIISLHSFRIMCAKYETPQEAFSQSILFYYPVSTTATPHLYNTKPSLLMPITAICYKKTVQWIADCTLGDSKCILLLQLGEATLFTYLKWMHACMCVN